jgi:TatD DNase family protein
MHLIDTHCHLDDSDFDADREAVIERARAAGIAHMVAIGTGGGPPDLCAGIRLAERYECMTATVGVHPHDAAKATEETWHELARLAAHSKVVALGEIGLDYHYDLSPRETQRAAFARQLEIAQAANLPITIHTREAWADTIALLHDGPAVRGVFHCFSGGPAEAEQALERGFLLSFSGVVTFNRSAAIREAARLAPLDRIVVETDAPYLAPVPHRGKRNEPAFVLETAQRVAALREITLDELAAAATANWRRLTARPAAGLA